MKKKQRVFEFMTRLGLKALERTVLKELIIEADPVHWRVTMSERELRHLTDISIRTIVRVLDLLEKRRYIVDLDLRSGTKATVYHIDPTILKLMGVFRYKGARSGVRESPLGKVE